MDYLLRNNRNSTRKERAVSILAECARRGDLSKLTDLWTDMLLQSPDPGDMLEALRALVSSGESAEALLLAETAAEEMDAASSPALLEFVSGAAELFERSPVLRRVLVEALRDGYMLYEPLEMLLERSGLLSDSRSLHGSWKTMRDFLKMQEGSYLLHPTYGPGMVSRVSRSAFNVDFQRSRDHDMSLEAVIETTRPVDHDSIPVLAWKDPIALAALVDAAGQPLLDRAMADLSTEGVLTRAGIAAGLAGTELDPAPFWRSVKTAARTAPGYVLVGDEIFHQKGSSTVDMVRSLLLSREPALSEKARVVDGLLSSDQRVPREEIAALVPLVCPGGKCVESGAAFELVWLLTGGDPGSDARTEGFLEKTSARVIRALSEIHSQSCRREYLARYVLSKPDPDQLEELMDNLPRGPRQLCRDILRDTDPGFLAGYLAGRIYDPSRTEIHLWSLEQAAEAGDMLPPEELTEQILRNLSRARADTQKRLCVLLMNRLRPSFESLIGGLDTRRLDRLAEELDQLASPHETGMLLLVRRQQNSRRIGENSRQKHFWETTAIFSSPSAIGAMHQEVDRLQQKEIPAAAEAIAEAATHGDLSENAEYKAALERRDLLLDTLDRRRKLLAVLRPYPEQDISERMVSPGTRVVIEALDDSGDARILGIVGPLDVDSEKGWINYQAPLGAALLGRTTGDSVTLPGEERTWRVSGVEVMAGKDLR